MKDITPVSKCECGHEEEKHHDPGEMTGCCSGDRLCGCPYFRPAKAFTPSIPQPEREHKCDCETPLGMSHLKSCPAKPSVIHPEPTPIHNEWEEEFRGKIQWMRFDTAFAAGKNTKELVAFISNLLEEAREKGFEDAGGRILATLEERKREIKEAEQRGYERGKKERVNKWTKCISCGGPEFFHDHNCPVMLSNRESAHKEDYERGFKDGVEEYYAVAHQTIPMRGNGALDKIKTIARKEELTRIKSLIEGMFFDAAILVEGHDGGDRWDISKKKWNEILKKLSDPYI